MTETKNILKNIFGYESFRPLQQEIIENVLSRNDTLIVMPTGGGKSICYQIPSMIFDGLTIVISPLISLMKDQVQQLAQLGVNAALLNSSLLPSEYAFNYNMVKNKKAKLLYLAPESLGKADLNILFSTNEVHCLAVDEAHCISEWGHDFRKDYRQLGNFRKKFPSAVCLALTATATPKVQDDIIANLNMTSYKKFIASFNRENLYLEVIPKRRAFEQTLSFLNEHKNQPGIIYCFSRKQVDDLSVDLADAGFSNKPYHAGLSDQERHRNQDMFTRDEVDIIVATIAFGMGINKSNVRFVIHYDLPKNIESYYQEIGRSGRDGLKADCLLLFSYGDIAKINYFIDLKEDEKERINAKLHLDAIVRYAESEKCRRTDLIKYFGEQYSIPTCGMCDNCVSEAKEQTDITIYAQKFLSAVKRTGEIYGASYLIDLLRGSESEKIIANRHQNLSVYGIGKEFDRKQWQLIVRQLISKELLIRAGEFGSLKITGGGSAVLKNGAKVFGMTTEPKTLKRRDRSEYDIELFELLRRKRKELAEQKDIPPFIIFSDKSLSEMAASYPRNRNEMTRVSGVGLRKYETYGEIFLSVIKKYCSSKVITGSKAEGSSVTLLLKSKRFVQVAEAFNNGSSVKSLCSQYNVIPETIIGHLFRYSNSGGKLNIDKVKGLVNLSPDRWGEVFKEFSASPDFTLSPIFEKFNSTISYNDLRLLRIIQSAETRRQI